MIMFRVIDVLNDSCGINSNEDYGQKFHIKTDDGFEGRSLLSRPSRHILDRRVYIIITRVCVASDTPNLRASPSSCCKKTMKTQWINFQYPSPHLTCSDR